MQAAKATSYYSVLGVASNAPKNVIRTSYLALAKKYHPDGAQGNAEKFKAINTAYETLYDETKRAVYDYDIRVNNGSGGSASSMSGGAGGGRARSNPFTQQEKRDFYYSYSWSQSYNTSQQQQQQKRQTEGSKHEQYHMYSERARRNHAFSDAEQRKKAAQEDVNYKNSYARFYYEYYSDEIDDYKRRLMREQRMKERMSDPRSPPRQRVSPTSAEQQSGFNVFSTEAFAWQPYNPAEEKFKEDPIVKQGAYTIISVEGGLCLIFALFIIRALWAKSQEDYPVRHQSHK